MLLPWLLFLLVCSCTGLPIPGPQAGDSSLGEAGGEAGAPPSLPRVMSALPEEQVILEEPVQEESTWDQGVKQASEIYPGHQLQTSYQQAYFTWPGQLHSHQNYQHSHHGHQHRHRHGPRGGIQFDARQLQQETVIDANMRHQENLLGLESGSVPSRFGEQQETVHDANTKHQEILLGLESGSVPSSRYGEGQEGGEHRVYQRHLGYRTLRGFQGNHPSVIQGSQDGIWYKTIQQDANNFAKSEDNVYQHDQQAYVNTHQKYHGYQPNYSNVRSYAQSGQDQALNSWNLPHQHHQLTYNAFLGQTNYGYPQAVSTQDPSTIITKAPSAQLDGSSADQEEETEAGLWSRGTSWISRLFPKTQLGGEEATVQE